MPIVSLEDAFGHPTQKPQRKRVSLADALPTESAEPAQKALDQQDALGLVRRSLKSAGFEDTDVSAGLDPDTREQFKARQAQVEGQLAEDKEISALGKEIASNRELLRSAEVLFARETKTVEDFQREALDRVPRPLRPFATGFAQAGLRSSSVIARIFDAEAADELSREGKKLSEIRVSLGTSRIEDAAESAVTSLTEVFTTAGLGLGTAGVALASGIRTGNDAITEGRDAGLEGLELASFAAGQGIIETGMTLAFNKILGPGLEAAGQPLKAAGKAGMTSTLKKLGIASLAELPEEITIELMSAYQSAAAGVGPELTLEQSKEIAIQTTLTTLLSVGAAQGIQVAQEIEARRGEAKAEPTPAAPAAKPEVLPTREDSIKVSKKRLTKLKEAAEKDKLTGLGNRALDERAVDTLFKRSDRTNKPVSLVSFDIANFKTLNDTLGLAAGDKALQVIADSIQAEVRGKTKGRPEDVAGVATRPGGDEFNVILPSTDKAGAEAVAKRIQARVDKALKAEGIDLPAEGRPVFAAPGVVERAPNDARSVEELRTEADFAVKAEKKRVKTELGVPLTREEAQTGDVSPASTVPTQETAAVAPEQASKAVTPSQLKAEVAATPKKTTPSALKKRKPRVIKRKKTVAQEVKEARKDLPGGKKSKFSPEGFRSVAAVARPRLDAMKATFAKETTLTPASRNDLLSLARTVLPPAERGKLIPAIARQRDSHMFTRQPRNQKGWNLR